MQKVLLSIVGLGACAGAVHAQSSVSVYGIADAGIVTERGGPGGNVDKLSSGIQSGSRLGFRGLEPLGQGLAATFVLEAGFNLDTGTMGQAGPPGSPTENGTLFGRQAYAGVASNWGSLLLGRQYTPQYTTLDQIDPFGVGLAGRANNLFLTFIRMDNTIKYTSPDWSGFTGELAYGFGEVPGDATANRQMGGSVGYANGPLTIKLAYHRADNPAATDSARRTLLGGKWDFGIATASLAFQRDKGIGATDNRDYLVGVSVPLAGGSILASYIRADDRSVLNRDADQWALGYLYPISRRTNFYTAFARIRNDNGAVYTVGNATETGTGDKAFNFGIRHIF